MTPPVNSTEDPTVLADLAPVESTKEPTTSAQVGQAVSPPVESTDLERPAMTISVEPAVTAPAIASDGSTKESSKPV